MSEPGYITIEQAAVRYCVSPKELRRKARLGKIPAHRLPGSRRYLFRVSELDGCLVGNGFVQKPMRRP